MTMALPPAVGPPWGPGSPRLFSSPEGFPVTKANVAWGIQGIPGPQHCSHHTFLFLKSSWIALIPPPPEVETIADDRPPRSPA